MWSSGVMILAGMYGKVTPGRQEQEIKCKVMKK